MPFESYNPRKESRETERAQKEHVQGRAEKEGIRLGFARSYTETAKPMDTLKGMIKRAYKEGKLYSEKQASEAAGEVVKRLETAGAKMRVNPGDRITFRNDSITLSAFDRKEARFVDTKLNLAEEEGSIGYKKREIVSAAQSARVDLAEEFREASRRPEATKKPRQQPSLPEQRQEAFRAFIRNTAELQTIIAKDEIEIVNVVRLAKPKTTIPIQFKDYEFEEIIVRRNGTKENYLIGIRPQIGEIVVFNAAAPEKNQKVVIKNFSNLSVLKLALRLISNPSQ